MMNYADMKSPAAKCLVARLFEWRGKMDVCARELTQAQNMVRNLEDVCRLTLEPGMTVRMRHLSGSLGYSEKFKGTLVRIESVEFREGSMTGIMLVCRSAEDGEQLPALDAAWFEPVEEGSAQ